MSGTTTDPGEGTGGWRAEAHRAQEEVLADGPVVVSSAAPYGTGGLGRHLAELVEAARRAGSLGTYLSPAPAPGDLGGIGVAVPTSSMVSLAVRLPPLRASAGRKIRAANRGFDAGASARLPPGGQLLTFNGHARRQFATARASGYRSVGVVSATAHMAHVARQHEAAWRRDPIERPWSSELLAGHLLEYGAADVVHVSSGYARESFLAEGFPEERLRHFPLTPHERFAPGPDLGEPRSTFDVVYVGGLAVHKGVPLLIEAVRRLAHADLRLMLVGGWGSRGMRRHVEGARAADPRIEVHPGDPLPHLARAGVCVHPSWSDGFGYAPAEALACGVPVIVTEHTGMKELVEPGCTGWIVPTGDVDALVDTIDLAYRGAA